MSSFHQGTLGLYDMREDLPIESLVVSTMMEVKLSTTVYVFI